MVAPFTRYKRRLDNKGDEHGRKPNIVEVPESFDSSKKDLEKTNAASGLPDRFHVVKLLGQGGMGTVYLVDDDELGCQLAVKVLSTESLADDGALSRFEVEASAASSLSHPHIAQVYSFSSDSARPHIVMEYVNGQSFDQILKRERIIEQERLLNIVLQICDALEYAHLHQVVHRDLKPSNIILQNEGDLVKIVDFGIAKVGPKNESATQLTQKGEIFGSPMYMSPEQAHAGTVDQRTDLYSIGCIIYEALSGKALFAGDNAIQMLLHHINTSPKPATRKLLKKGYSRSFVAMIEKLLEKNPADRYQSASDLARDIRRILDGKPSYAFLKKPFLFDIPIRKVAVALAITAGVGLVATCLYSTFTVANIEHNAKNRTYESMVSRQNEARELVARIAGGKREDLYLAARALAELIAQSNQGYYSQGPSGLRELLSTADQQIILKAFHTSADSDSKLELARTLIYCNKPAPEVLSFACSLCSSKEKSLRDLGAEGVSKWAPEASSQQQEELSTALSRLFLTTRDMDSTSGVIGLGFQLDQSIARALATISKFSAESVLNFRKEASEAKQDWDSMNSGGYYRHQAHPLVYVSETQKTYFPELLCLLKSQGSLPSATAALIKLGPAAKEAAPALIEMLDSSEGQQRKSAWSILAAIGPGVASEAVPALTRAFERHRANEAPGIAQALSKMGPAGVAVLKKTAAQPLKPTQLDTGGENAVINAAQDILLELRHK